MKKHIIVPVVCICLLAFLLADIVYQKYLDNISISGNVYFLQTGVYKDKRSIKEISTNYITVEEEDKYYTYLGMTMDKKIANKLKEIYENKNIPIYIKEVNITNQEFLNELSQYDILLNNADNTDEIENILETILSTYEETLKTS